MDSSIAHVHIRPVNTFSQREKMAVEGESLLLLVLLFSLTKEMFPLEMNSKPG